MTNRTPRLLAALVLLLLAGPALAGAQSFVVYVDTDNVASTGCTVSTAKGAFAGVEVAVETTVTTTTTDARVTAVRLLTCGGGVLGSPQVIDSGSWPVLPGTGDLGTAVVETFVPLSTLGSSHLVRVAIGSTAEAGGTDAMLVATAGGPILIPLDETPAAAVIPVLSDSSLVLLAIGLGLAGLWILRSHPSSRLLFVAALFLLGAGVALAAVVLDGQIADWSGQSVRATDPKGNAPVDADLVSFYGQVDAGRLYLRIDADVKADTPTPTPTPTPGPTATPTPTPTRTPTPTPTPTGIVTLDPVPDQTIPTNMTLSLRLSGHSTNVFATLTYGLVAGPTGATVTLPGVFGITPAQGQLGTQSVTVRVQDQSGQSAQQTFLVTVVDHNHAPVLGALPDDITAIGASYVKTLTATDPDAGDVLTFTLLSGPTGMTLTGSQLSWTPTASQLGNWPVEVKVTDQKGASDSGLFHVGIPLVSANDDQYEVKVGETLAVAAPGVLGNDVNPVGGSLAATKLTDPDKGTLFAFGADGSFTYRAPAAIGTTFQPVVKPGWTSHTGIDGDGGQNNLRVVDVDGDGKPEIITERTLGGGWGNSRISVLRGTNGSTLWSSDGFYLPPPNEHCVIEWAMWLSPDHLAVGDIDDSGHPAIIVPVQCPGGPNGSGPGHGQNRLAALDGSTGAFKWLSPELSSPNDDGGYWAMTLYVTPAIARLRPGESPSVLFNRLVSGGAYSGQQNCSLYGGNVPGCTVVTALDGATGALRQRWFAEDNVNTGGTTDTGRVIVSDLTGSGSPNIIAGSGVWDVNGNLLRSSRNSSAVLSLALANLDDSGQTAVISYEMGGSGQGWVVARRPDGTLLWRSPASSSDYRVGELVVADLYGDGRPKVLASVGGYLYVYDEHGALVQTHRFFDAAGNLTTYQHNRPAVFDLDGDGVPELIVQTAYGIEFFDGRTGVRKANVTYESLGYPTPAGGTYASPSAYLGPLVVDVDGDGHAEVLFNIVTGIYPLNTWTMVLESQADDWQPARPVWNQFAMHDSNVADNGSIPQVEVNNFKDPRTNVFANPVRIAPKVDPRKRDQAKFTYEAAAGGYTSNVANVTVDILPPNRPPVFTSTPPTTYMPFYAATPTNPYFPFVYQAHASDPDPGDTITYSITARGGAESYQFAIDANTGLVTAFVFGGNPFQTEWLVIGATDNWGAAVYQNLELKPSLGPALVPNVVGQQKTVADATLAAAGFGTGVVTEVESPEPAGQVLTQVPGAGASVLTGELVALTVSLGPPGVDPPGPPPDLGNLARIVVTPASALRVTGETAPFKAIGTYTDGTGADLTAYVAWSSSLASVAGVDAAGLAHAASAGTTTVTATANGLTGSALLTVSVRAAGDAVPPVAVISAPASGGNVSGLTQVLGTATDANFLRYELALAREGDTAFSPIGQGTSPVTSGLLGTLDPTQLVNGAYTLRLTVYDANGNTAAVEVPIVVDGGQKVGNFTISYTDLTVRLAGIPIQVSRTYDSRDKRSGDFGVGWSLGVKTVRTSESGVLGDSWRVVQQGTGYALVPGEDHFVSVTLPDGRVETFDLRLTPTSSFLVPFSTLQASLVPRAGVIGTLQSLDNMNILILDPQPGPITLLDDTTLNTFNPDRFRYTRLDGTQYVLTRTKGVESVRDTNGNQVTIGPSGILHSSGVSVPFVRDASGRVTSITDPNGHARTYSYSPTGDLAAHTNAASSTTGYFYDARQGLVRIVDPLGLPVARTEYDDEGRVVSITDAAGHRTTYQHDLPGRQEQVTDPLGNVTLLTYDDRGNVLTKTDPLGHQTTFTFDGRDNPLSETDALGRVSTKTYDANDNVLTTTDFDGHLTTYTYDANGRVLSTVDPEGKTRTSGYDANGNLTSVTDPEGGGTNYTYDAAGNRLTTKDPMGHVTTFTYDVGGRRLSASDPLGNTTAYAYDGIGNRLSETDPLGKTATWAYDALGRATTVTDKLGHATALTYSDQGDGHKLLTRTDVNGHVTTLSYDDVGNLLGYAFPDGTAESVTYDFANRPVTIQNGAGAVSSVQYDALGRRTAFTDPTGGSSHLTFDAADRPLTWTNERGKVTTYSWPASRRRITDALGNTTEDVFDSSWRRVKTTDPLGHVTMFTYDSRGNLTKTTFPDGTSSSATYDAAGRLTARTDQAGQATQFAFDAAGHLVAVTDASGHTTSYTYDAAGNRLTQVDANGHVTQMTYDAMGRILTRALPSGMHETFAYDVSGNEVGHTDYNGGTTTFEYDSVNRLVKKNLPDGSSVPFAYTASGRRLRAGGDLYTYDAFDRLVEERKASGEFLTYTYDAAGNRTSVATPQGTTSYTYDSLDRIVTAVDSNGTTQFTYGPAGTATSAVYPNGVTAAYGYDALNRLSSVANSGPGGLISSYTYTLGLAGERTQVVEAGPGTTGRSVSYSFDPTYRLTQEIVSEPAAADLAIDYTYDAAGNRSQMTGDGVATTYTYDVNDRLISETSGGSTITATYDDNGNLTARSNGSSNTTYGYDAEDRLLHVTDPGGTVAFTYDADGMRISKTAGGALSTYLLDKNRALSQVLVETTGATTTTYTYGHDQLISQTQSGAGAHFYLTDGQRSVRHLTSPAGVVTDRYTYDAFGVTLAASGSTPNAYQYQGERRDADVGLYYLRARYYDPGAGRFVSADPVQGDPFRPVSLHRYLYAEADPVNKEDPSGRDVFISKHLIGGFNEAGYLHWNLNVDNRDGGLTSLGFGPAGNNPVPQLIVSWDQSGGASTQGVVRPELREAYMQGGYAYWGFYYMLTTPDEDDFAKSLLPAMVVQRPYSVLNQNCREFAAEAYETVRTKIWQVRITGAERRGVVGSIVNKGMNMFLHPVDSFMAP